MSDFEEYIKNKYPEDYAVLSTMYSNQAMEELYPDQFEVWQHQQAKIEKLENELSTTKQVLGNVIDMEVAKIDDLKAQLNNMEACYIEKKKEVEACAALVSEWREKPIGGWSDYARGGLHSRQDCTDDLEKALRGES